MTAYRGVTLALGLLMAGCAGSLPPSSPTPSATSPSAPLVTTASADSAPAATAPQNGRLNGQATAPNSLMTQAGVIPTGIGRYRTLALDAELPLAGATVTLRDAATHVPLEAIAPVTTDSQGRFAFSDLSLDQNVLIDVWWHPQGQKGIRLLALARPSADLAAAAVAVTWSSTGAVIAVLGDQPGSPGSLNTVNQVRSAQQQIASSYQSLPTSSQAAFLMNAMTIPLDFTLPDRSSGTPAPSVSSSGPLPVGSGQASALGLPLPAGTSGGLPPSATPFLPSAGSTLTGATSALTSAAASTVRSTTSALTSATTSTAGATAVAPGTAASSAVSGTTNVVSTLSQQVATPAPTAAPTTAPVVVPHPL